MRGVIFTAHFIIIVVCLLAHFVAGDFLIGLKVRGNTIVNGHGDVVQLRGVDHSGTEFACIDGYGIFDGPYDQASVDAIKSWKTNVVRVPLNEDCWLGINGVKPEYGGENYQKAIRLYVDLLTKNDFAVILDLHWTAPGGDRATGQKPMPDKDHSITFWQQVAGQYKSDTNVIFDLFNEPFPDNNAWNTAEAWNCWKNGGTCNGIDYQVAGMQDLVNAVRGAKAPNILMLGGIMYSNSLVQWWESKPNDPLQNIVPSWHSYNFNECGNENCWNTVVAPLAQKVPIIAGEIGENDCSGGYINSLMQFMDAHKIHYLAWTWNNWNCNTGPALIKDWTGTPTNFGAAYKAHLAAVVSTNNQTRTY